MADADSKREQFLLHLYDQLWQSIGRAEQGIWQYLSLYGVIIGVHWIAAKGEIDRALAVYLSFIASFLGINIAINAGKWFERNRMMIINVEKEFLRDDDLGRIIPASYHQRVPHKGFETQYVIYISLFIVATVLSLMAYWGELQKNNSTVLTILLVLAGAAVTLYHWYRAWNEVRRFVEETKGMKRI